MFGSTVSGKVVCQCPAMRLKRYLLGKRAEREEANIKGIIRSLHLTSDYVSQIEDKDRIGARIIGAGIYLEKRGQLYHKAGLLADLANRRLAGVLVPFHEAGGETPPSDPRWMRPFDHQDLIILNNHGSSGGDRVLIENVAALIVRAKDPDATFLIPLNKGLSAKGTESKSTEVVLAGKELLGVKRVVFTGHSWSSHSRAF